MSGLSRYISIYQKASKIRTVCCMIFDWLIFHFAADVSGVSLNNKIMQHWTTLILDALYILVLTFVVVSIQECNRNRSVSAEISSFIQKINFLYDFIPKIGSTFWQLRAKPLTLVPLLSLDVKECMYTV